MNRGILIFAHNSRDVDYALLSLISGGLAKKNLGIPVSLVLDSYTLEWCKESNIFQRMKLVFDQIIEIDKPKTNNTRNLFDGADSKSVPFNNVNRYSAWNLTPYDHTLLIDGDFLIFSDNLNHYWQIDESILLSHSMNDIYNKKRMGYHDRYISDTGIHLYWATTVMFKKDTQSKLFFDTVNYVKENYQYYADVFRFNSKQFRNDIAFSLAKHILDGFQSIDSYTLPPVLTVQGKDILYDVSGNSKMTFLISTDYNNYSLASINKLDVHIMNKQSIIRNKDKLLELI